MESIFHFFDVSVLAHDLFLLSIVITVGLVLGSLRFKGLSLGVAGALFAGLFFGHCGFKMSPEYLELLRDLGLILFVFTVGLQVGPGFFGSLRAQGLKLNLLAFLIILTSTAIVWVYVQTGLLPFPVGAGLLCGSTTNTPSLGAAQASLSLLKNIDPESLKLPSMAYAISYPFGVTGILLTMLLIRYCFKILPRQEAENFKLAATNTSDKIISFNLQVENPALDQTVLSKMPFLKDRGLVISRIWHDKQLHVATSDSVLHLNDIVHIVGPQKYFKEAQILIGSVSAIDLRLDVESQIESRKILLTQKNWVGKTVEAVVLSATSPVVLTRIIRAGFELPVTPQTQLNLADTLVVVGQSQAIKSLEETLGNSESALHIPQLIPVFLGIALGLFLGSVPIHLPGLPYPVRLGSAAGPLLAAIILARLGRIGKVIWYMPAATNLFLREFGIVLFLACVGLKSGDKFVDLLLHGPGIKWMLLGAMVTLIPLLLAGFVGRFFMRLNYLTLCGLLAASSSSPPGLAFVNAMAESGAASVGYATVYPMVMILRIILVQILVLYFGT